jgi:hypothetical protein
MWQPESYTISAFLLPRLLGLIYFFAIGAFLFQIRGLLGRDGLLPVQEFLDYVYRRHPHKWLFYVPSLFWLNASNLALMGLTVLGTGLSVALMLGIYPSLCLGLLFVIYLSIVSTGQDFLGFGWEGFLLEITFYTFWMSLTTPPHLMIWICLNLLLFRFNFLAGAVKLQSHDRNWRNLSALAFHYQSQPLPNTNAWYLYKWPLGFQQASTLLMFIIELIVPFGLFLSDSIRATVGIAFIGLQLMIWLTGNFSYLNHLTVVFSLIAFSDAFWSPWIAPLEPSPSNEFLNTILFIVGSVFIVLQLLRLWNHFWPHPRLARCFYWFSPFHLVNRYGIFAVMTTRRDEIVVEGSDDGENWKEYLCWYKPSEITRRPRRISPYQPRLDWQMWFLPFNDFEAQSWFHYFLYHLLKGSPDVLNLLRYNPFPQKPPKYIRAVMYEYEFSSRQEKKEKGWWWRRDYKGLYSPIMSLKEL